MSPRPKRAVISSTSSESGLVWIIRNDGSYAHTTPEAAQGLMKAGQAMLASTEQAEAKEEQLRARAEAADTTEENSAH